MANVLIGKISGVGSGLHGSLTLPVTSASVQVVVPSDEVQEIVPKAGYNAMKKVIVQPIPSNYGKISWNGVRILVT